jgi:hypothetical protein
MRRLLVLLLLTFSAITALAHTVAVNCDAGQSLNTAISKLNKEGPNRVLVQGTCSEYVTIAGFEDVTVTSTSGATLVQPNVVPTNGLPVNLLQINSSRRVTIDGLNFSSDSSKPPAIGILLGSIDVRLRNLLVVGGNAGIIIGENSQVSIAKVTVRNAGWASVGIFDRSDARIESCVFEDLTGTSWHSGVNVGGAHVAITGSTVRNMDVGIVVNGTGALYVEDYPLLYPPDGPGDVVIDNSAGKNATGVSIDGASSVTVSNAKLRITNAGGPVYGDAIDVSNGSVLNASANLIISGSHGQGILVKNNSTAELDGSSISGGLHGGLVAVNYSTISANTWDKTTSVSGNFVDLSCDSNSLITGGVHIVNATVIYCPNVLPGDTPGLP